MSTHFHVRLNGIATIVVASIIGVAAGLSTMVVGAASESTAPRPGAEAPTPDEASFEPGTKRHLDRSGRKQVGKASFYKDSYAGKKMADGTPMQLNSNNAASLTLPLGTTAKVTNLETGKTAIVTIRDRGPYVKGRIVDLSPATARSIGLDQKKGIAQVVVKPIAFPDAPPFS